MTRTGRSGVAIAALIALAALAAGAEQEAALDPAWIPAVSVGVDLTVVDAEGSVTSSSRGLVPGGKTARVPVVAMGLQLTGPRGGGQGLPSRVRTFAHGRYDVWTSTYDVARQGDPGTITPPENVDPGTDPANFAGQGSQLRMRGKGSWVLGLGADFEVPFAPGADFHVKPSLDYYGMQLELAARLRHVEKSNGQFGFSSIDVGDRVTYHALGPRLQIESELVRRGPVALSVYAGAFFYFVLGDTRTTFGSTQGSDTLVAIYDQDSLVAGGGAGLRLSYLGF